MISKNIVKQPKSIVEIQITVPWADIEPMWNAVLQQMAQEVEISGFRKGTAPLPMVEQQLGNKLQDEVFKQVMPQSLMQALEGTTIVPIDYPQYQITNFQKGNQLQFTAKVTERPTITIGDYKTVKANKPPVKPVNDEEVNKIIDELFRRWKMKNPQPVAQSQSQPGQSGMGGSLSFNQPSANSSAPSATPAEVNEPNDTFAQGVGAQSLADLKTKIRQDLENEAKYNNELDYEEAILQEVEKITTVDIPEVLIQDELNRMLVSLQRSVTERGLLLDEYLKTQNKTVDQIKNEWRPQAEKNVRMELGLSEIARSEGINISDDELQAEIDKIQDARVKAQFGAEEPRMHLRHALRQTKTLNLLKSVLQ